MVTSSDEIRNEINALRKYLVKNKNKLPWEVEGALLKQIDMLKKDLLYAEVLENPSSTSHALEMKIKYG